MDQLRFDGKVAIVTGAGGGLGKAYASLLANRGAKVLVNDLGVSMTGDAIDSGYAQAAAEEIRRAGGIAEANGDDVSTRAGADRIFAQALDQFGQVDILINNAGVVRSQAPLWDIADEQWDDDIAVSATGTFQMCRAVWKHMWERGSGRIVNTSSGSVFGMGTGIGYPAAKGAVWAITRNMAVAAEHHGKDIRVNCIMPLAAGRLTHLFGEPIASAMQREFPPESVAPAVAYLCHDDVTFGGELFRVGGGGMRHVFIGLTPGYQAGVQWSPEDVRDNIDTVFDRTGFIVPKTQFESSPADSSVDLSEFRKYVM